MTGPSPQPTRPSQPETVFPENALYRVADELADRFYGTFSRETIDRYLIESYDLLRMTAKVGIHLPVLAARFARERLTALAELEGLHFKQAPTVLFVCVHNAGRSQLAAALLHRRIGAAVRTRSAGSSLGGAVDPAVLRVADELKLDLGLEVPKPLTDEIVRAADVVITMGCGDTCPVFPGKRYEDWKLDDPAGQNVQAVRPIRDEIRGRIQRLAIELPH
ncbi:low molecular weight phosphatase family protein [Actinomadura chibensis]|uniref:Arsenate reductase ArsC n=1 Tax=Actinomadura chibensis TaxID=392828 RepID=A0A5D0N8Y3_9ACTN|nr:phosphatase [Actinomadura chibensis]TYB40786.1 arsenate reductase ArsC [Actinomadura chibensis]